MRCKGTEVSYRTLPPLERDGEREREIYLETHPDISLLTVIAQALSTQDISLTSRSHFSWLAYHLETLLWLTWHPEPLLQAHLPLGATSPDSPTSRSHFSWLAFHPEPLPKAHLPFGVTSPDSLTIWRHFSWLTYHPESLLWLTYHSESPTTSLLNSSYQERFKDSSLCLPSEADVEL